MLKLASGDTEVAIDPWNGGGIASFSWKGRKIFRPRVGDQNPTDLASFPLVPFCNRIANGRLVCEGRERSIMMSRKGIEEEHSIHGLGWVSPWTVTESGVDHAELGLRHDGAIWPWAFEAKQRIRLGQSGYTHALSVTNTDTNPMPAGLGLHPYFPRHGAALKLDVTGYWRNGPDRLPSEHIGVTKPPKWFAKSGFDNCFTGRSGLIEIAYPDHSLTIETSKDLAFTHVYSPPGEEFFCVEPVSHIPDAVNSALSNDETGLRILKPGEEFEVSCTYSVEELS